MAGSSANHSRQGNALYELLSHQSTVNSTRSALSQPSLQSSGANPKFITSKDPKKRQAAIAAARARSQARSKQASRNQTSGENKHSRIQTSGEDKDSLSSISIKKNRPSNKLQYEKKKAPTLPEKVRSKAHISAQHHKHDKNKKMDSSTLKSTSTMKSVTSKKTQLENAQAKLEAMPIKLLKATIKKYGLSYHDCVTKKDIYERAKQVAPLMVADVSSTGRDWFRKGPPPAEQHFHTSQKTIDVNDKLPPALRSNPNPTVPKTTKSTMNKTQSNSFTNNPNPLSFNIVSGEDESSWSRSRLVEELRNCRIALKASRDEVFAVREAAAKMFTSETTFRSTAMGSPEKNIRNFSGIKLGTDSISKSNAKDCSVNDKSLNQKNENNPPTVKTQNTLSNNPPTVKTQNTLSNNPPTVTTQNTLSKASASVPPKSTTTTSLKQDMTKNIRKPSKPSRSTTTETKRAEMLLRRLGTKTRNTRI